MRKNRQHVIKKAICLVLCISMIVPSVLTDVASVYALNGQNVDNGVNTTSVDEARNDESAGAVSGADNGAPSQEAGDSGDESGGSDIPAVKGESNPDTDGNKPATVDEPAAVNEPDTADHNAVTSVMGQIHWDDKEYGWNKVIRPTSAPADPNKYINLWEYSGDTTEGAVKLALQSTDPGAPYYCVITPTEGLDYWTYSIANVPTGDDAHFYATGPAFTGYNQSENATEKPQEGDISDSVKLNYIEYTINYQPVDIHVNMMPANDTGTVGVNIKLGPGKDGPDKASINYSGTYTVIDKDNVKTDGSTSNGNIKNLGHNTDITLNKVPEGVAYNITAIDAGQYIVRYDESVKGVVGANGAETTITNLSNNAKATLTKKWNDNMDENRSEEEFRKSLVLEYKLDNGEFIEVDGKAAEQLGIDGDITFAIEDKNNVWNVKALHGGKENFPAVWDNGTSANVITYRIVEKPMNGYVSSVDEDGTVTNTKATEFTGTINWKDIDCIEDRPETASYNVKAYYIDGAGDTQYLDNDFLARYGIEDGKITVDVSKDSDTTVVDIKNIPMYSDDGYQIAYSILQEPVTGYVAKYDNKETDHGTNVKECFDGGEINNTRTEITHFAATKEWVDGGNTEADGGRPEATVYLYRYANGESASTATPIVIVDTNGVSHVISKKLDDDMDTTEMSIDFEEMLAGISGTNGLFKYDENGREYKYFVKEVLDDKTDADGIATNPKYYKTYLMKDAQGNEKETDALYNGGKLINSRIPMVDVSVQKTWETASVPEAPRGAKVKFKILRTDEGGKTTYVKDGADDLVVELSGFEPEKPTVEQIVTLPKCDEMGKSYKYSLEEISVEAPEGILGLNKDILNDDGTMELDGHTYTFSSDTLDMSSGEFGAPIVADGNETATLTGYNKISDEMDYKIVKTWNGVPDPTDDYTATMKITRYDYQGNKDDSFNPDDYVFTLTTENEFTHTYKNLPVYDSKGYQYEYRASETDYTAPDGQTWGVHYKYSYDKNAKIAVTEATNYVAGGDTYITVTKNWNDDGDTQARQNVIAQVYDSEGNIWSGKTVTLSESNGWSGEIGFKEDEKDRLNEGITVIEKSVGGHDVDYNGGDSEYDSLKSDDMTLGVVRTGTNGYIYKVQNNGSEDNRHFTITNTRIGKTNVKLTKVWVDGSRDNDERPSIEIILTTNGENPETYEVDKDSVNEDNSNEWIYTIENLEKYDAAGKIINYEISEVDTAAVRADHYTSRLEVGEYDVEHSTYHSGDVRNYTLTNRREAKTEYKVYKIWKDPETTTRRPDISIDLYYSVAGDDTLYKYGEGPMAEYQTEEIAYRWASNPATSDRSHDSTCTVKDLMMYSPVDGSEIKYYSKENMVNRGEYQTFYWTDLAERQDALESDTPATGKDCAGNGEYIENRVIAELSLKGVKYWNNMQAGTKAENLDTSGVMITLYQYVGEKRPSDFVTNPDKYKIDEVSLKNASKDNRNFTFGKVPKYNDDGKLYNYELLETINGKLGFVYKKDPSGYAITNTFKTGPDNNRIISVKKIWNADKYIESLRASQNFEYPKITFELYRSSGKSDDDNSIDFNGTPHATLTLNHAGESGTITDSFDPQLIWSENGVQYKYAVVEKIGDNVLPAYTINSSDKTVNINDGGVEYTPDNKPGEKIAEFTNTYEPQDDLTIKGKKVWKDSNNPELRPDSINIEVWRKANGTSDSVAITDTKLASVTDNPDNPDYTVTWTKKGNEWSYEIEGPAIAEFAPNGQRWVYTVKEVQSTEDASNYNCSGNATQNGSVSGGVQNMNTITNSLKGEFTVKKSWDDNNNEYALRPTVAVVALKRSSDGGNTWEYVTNGNDTNDEEKSDFQPGGAGSTDYNVLSHKLSYSGNEWSYTFKNLAPNDKNGNAYIYEGVEIAVGVGDELHPCIYTKLDGDDLILAGSYRVTSSTSDSTTTITNTLDPTTITILKKWEDDGDAYDSRPKNKDGIPQITVKLQRTLVKDAGTESSWTDVYNSAGNLVTKDLKSRDDNPTWQITNLPKCDYSGQEYAYRAVEITDDLTEAYDTEYDYSNLTVTKITNSLIYRDSQTIKAEKIWIDGDSDDRPSSVTLELTRWVNGSKVDYPKNNIIVLDGTAETDSSLSYGEMDAWEACWTNLPKQDNKGNEYEYKVEEIKVGNTPVANGKAAGYLVQKSYDGDTDKYTFTNVESTEFTVTKTFTDDEYVDLAKRATSVTVELQRSTDGTNWEDVESREIKGFNKDTNSKSTKFVDLPKYDENDNLYTYRAVETKLGSTAVADNYALGYDVSYDNSVTGKTAITNSMRTVNITGYKTWNDQSDHYGLRPALADVAQSNLKVELVTGTAENNSSVKSQPKPVWESTTDADKWKFTFKGLPLYDSEGKLISYMAKETACNLGYSADTDTILLTGDFSNAKDGDTITVSNGSDDNNGIVNNLITVNVEGTKTWNDGVNGSGVDYRPESITLTLKDTANNRDVTVTLPDDNPITWTKKDNDNNEWTYKYSNLPMYYFDSKGGLHECKYEVVESSLSNLGYTNPSYTNSTKTVDGVKEFVNNITNTIDRKTIKATKVWDDQKNKYSTRPDGWNNTNGTGIFTVYSSVDGGNSYTEMAEQPKCAWSNPSGDKKNYVFTVENLQKWYIDGNSKTEIQYKVQEDSVPSNYTSETSGDGLTITNKLSVVDFSGKKVWADNSNAYGTRPAKLTLTLERKTADDTEWEAVPGNPDVNWTNNDNNHNEWSYSYSGLPEKNLKGKEYTYRVKETVPTGYHTSSATALDNGTLTNTFDYGTLVINKVFGEQKNNGTADKPLATFTIQNEAKTQKFVVKTDTNGHLAQASDGSYTDVNGNKFWLIPGKYTMKESSVENGAEGTVFVPDSTTYDFTIEENGSSVTASNAANGEDKVFVNNPARGNVTILKIDDTYTYTSSTKPVARNTNKTQLAGAEFNLCLDKEGTKVVTALVASTANPGVYELPNTADGNYKTNSLGIAYLNKDGLITGTYWLVETKTPTGYSINKDESPKEITVAPATGTTTVSDQTVDVGNTLIEKPFKISKTYEVPNLNAWNDTDKKKINEGGSSAQADTDHTFTFTIERIAGTPAFTFKKTVTTDKDGIADFGNIPYGEYSVTEYDSTAYVPPVFGHIIVDSEGVHRGDSVLTDGVGTAYNTLKRGTISGTKMDTTSVAGQSKPVKGAVIGIYSGDTLLTKATTDDKGEYKFTSIPYGSYVVKEVKAPANYVLSTVAKNVSITDDDQEISLTGNNGITDAPAVAELNLHKVDNETGAAMKDVAFALAGTDFMGNTINKTGKTTADGNLTISGLPVGSYTLTETKVDDYEAPDSFNITVSNSEAGNSNNTVIAVEKVAASDSSKSDVTADNGVYTVTNTRIRRSFTFDKVSETDGDNGSPLAGAEFTAYTNADCTTALTYNERTVTATSNNQGKVTFTNLPCGTWYIKETSAPSDFKTGSDVYAVTVDQNGTVSSDDITDPIVNEAIRGKLSVLKFDELYVYTADGNLTERGENKQMLNDAEFQLCLDKDGNNVIATLVPSATDTGVYELPEAADTGSRYAVDDRGITYLNENGLICGTYWIVETRNPEGYYTKTTECPQQVTVTADTVTHTVVDIPVNVANTLIEKPFKITKTYEVPNKVDVDDDGAHIDQEGRWVNADNNTHKFTFTVERTSGSNPAFKFSKTVSTNENGVADFGNLPYGKYTVTENDTDAYVTPVISDITVDAEGVHQGGKVLENGNTDVANYLKRGKIIGAKMDVSSRDGESVPVKGAVMGLYLDGVCVEKSTTDANGKYEFTNITYGTYVVKEIKAPANYLLSTTEKSVIINTNEQVERLDTAETWITDPPALTDLKLNKVQNELDNAVMADVEFALEGTDFMGNEITRTGKTTEDGNLTISDLPAGTYKLTETKVEDFEEPDSFNISIESVEDGNSNKLAISVKKIAAKDDSKSDVSADDNGIYTVENTRIRRSFSFIKTGTDDELDLTHAKLLAGAEFKLYSDEKCDDTDEFTDNVCSGVAISDEDGKVTFEDIPCGTWYIKETKAPDNYSLDETVYKVTVNQDGTVESDLQTSVNEAIRGKVTFTTVDMNDPEKVVPGATYKIYKLNKETGEYEELATGVTDENGVLSFENLLIGEEYRIEEVEAPAGYQVSKNPVDFGFLLDGDKAVLDITDNGDGTVTTDEEGNVIWYQPPTCVDVSKLNLKGDMLAGAEFEIKDSDGKVVESWTSETSEHEVIAILTAGETYTLEEVKAPEGYMTADPLEFTVEAVKVGPDGLYRQKVVMEDEVTEASIAKVDENRKALKGAKFKLSGKLADGSEEMTIDMSKRSDYNLKNLLVEGEKYTLSEITEPDGYEKLNKDVVFRFNKDDEIELVKYQKGLVTVSSEVVKGKEIYTISIQNIAIPADDSDENGVDTGDNSPLMPNMLIMLCSLLMTIEIERKRRGKGSI